MELLSALTWKSHHRDTNNLLGVYWDFIDSVPTIVGAFYLSELDPSHWGSIVQPTEGGGRTTSVSVMNRAGRTKMQEGWLCVIDDDRYVSKLNRLNPAVRIAVPAGDGRRWL